MLPSTIRSTKNAVSEVLSKSDDESVQSPSSTEEEKCERDPGSNLHRVRNRKTQAVSVALLAGLISEVSRKSLTRINFFGKCSRLCHETDTLNVSCITRFGIGRLESFKCLPRIVSTDDKL